MFNFSPSKGTPAALAKGLGSILLAASCSQVALATELASSDKATSLSRGIIDDICLPQMAETADQASSATERLSTTRCGGDNPPTTPSNISVPSTSSTGNYQVTWGASAGANQYRLERKNGALWSPVFSGYRFNYQVTGQSSGSYLYRVKACNDNGCSGYRYSGTIQVTAVPTAPSAILYSDYSGKEKLKVSWSPVLAAGISYQLEQMNHGQSWTSIYQGASTEIELDLSNGSYRFRVRACNSDGCSPYQSGHYGIINKLAKVDLHNKYAFLKDYEQQVDNYAQSTPSFASRKGSYPIVGSNGTLRVTGDDRTYNLGQGYNVIGDAFHDVCIDTEQNGFEVIKQPTRLSDDYEYKHITSTKLLYQLFAVRESTGLTFIKDSFLAGFVEDKQRFLESVADDQKEYFVMRWKNYLENWSTSIGGNEVIKPEYVSKVLKPNDETAKHEFRGLCGDEYVSEVELGAHIYLVFSYDAKTFAKSEREYYSSQIDLILNSVLSAGHARDLTQAQINVLTASKLSVKAYAWGGPEGFAPTINISNFPEKYREWVSLLNDDNLQALDLKTRPYPIPFEFAGHPRDAIYADWFPHYQNMGRWMSMDIEREKRCQTAELYNADSDRIDTQGCTQAAKELESAKKACFDHTLWDSCKHPYDYYTRGPNDPTNPSPLPNNILLNDKLTELVPKWKEETVYENFGKREVTGGVWNKKCVDLDELVCLPENACVEDNLRGYNLGVGLGFGEVLKKHSPGSGAHQDSFNVVTSNGKKCLRSDIQACTKRIGGSKAWIELAVEMMGRCPSYTPLFQ
ncbi:fibronectin type III domain-containing protein [Pleionea sp. CnH1-48]|uniref:fibronectin type III domain-containing protein n=1 Tax=Pleionea sp. CnH1-48 TaxID=2954494 RepID=UPI002097FBA4|nr:fibronectin type III domain-containing protein [Pleionea sp. CnH1-48]MCO7226172.1 fibronectin type III domain-containing protein [Pleionea sp. CnH1-48]